MKDSADKSHDPTEARLRRARDEEGDVPKSTEVAVAAGYAVAFLFVVGLGASMVPAAAAGLSRALADGDGLFDAALSSGWRSALWPLLGPSLALLGVWMGLSLLAVLLAYGVQMAITPRSKRLAPKLSRVSPLSNAEQKYGPQGLMSFGRSALKLTAMTAILSLLAWSNRDRILGSAGAPPGAVVDALRDLGRELLLWTLIIAGAVAALDLPWQRASHRRKLRMSLQEVRDEAKSDQGDPMVRAQRRRRAEDIATNRMMRDVPTASVVITNPTHISVALAWDPAKGAAPRLVAAGADEVALRIRELATGHGVPLYRDPPTARRLHRDLRVGEEVAPDHYRAVATAIRFAERMRRLAK